VALADDDDVIYFQYDSSTPLRFSAPAYYIHEKLRAKDKKSPCQDCSTPSGMRQTSIPALFFFGDAHHLSAQSSHYPLDPSINFTPKFFKRQHPHVAEEEGHRRITALMLP
jgi:hypothetical protein